MKLGSVLLTDYTASLQGAELIGYAASIFIGVCLGLIGGGGSILTLPVLVYLLGINPVLSTTYSLFIVGITSLVGSLDYMCRKLVHYPAALAFAIPSFATVFLTRTYVLPTLIEPFFSIGGLQVSSQVTLMVFFALIMMGAAWSMIRPGKEPLLNKYPMDSLNYPLIAFSGVVVGLLTGGVGAGGGFLIIPALVGLARLSMKMAVGTSLLIIAAKSLTGFLGDVPHFSVNWHFLLAFTALSVSGIFLGAYLSRFVDGNKLKHGFGWLIMSMSIAIFFKELINQPHNDTSAPAGSCQHPHRSTPGRSIQIRQHHLSNHLSGGLMQPPQKIS